jgi:hypothetical protein
VQGGGHSVKSTNANVIAAFNNVLFESSHGTDESSLIDVQTAMAFMCNNCVIQSTIHACNTH